MSLSIAQLTTATTQEAALELLLDLLESEGFPARSWQEGSVNRVQLEVQADLLASNSVLIADITKGGFNDLATGDGLTAYSASAYENERVGAVRAQFDIELTVASGSGPYTPAIGAVLVKDPGLNLQYRSLTALTLTSAASPITGRFEAEVAGTGGNAPGTNDIDTLVSALAGVTVKNPSGTPDKNGANAELDDELQTRNTNKWALLSENSPKGVYVSWALAGDASVTRVSVDDTNSAGAGKVVVYLADKAIGLGSPTTTTVLAYINARKTLGATVTVLAAVSKAQTVTYVATHDPLVFSSEALAKTAIKTALDAYFETLPISGIGLKLPLGGIYNAANAVVGIVNVTFTVPTVDVVLLITQVVIPTISGTSTALT